MSKDIKQLVKDANRVSDLVSKLIINNPSGNERDSIETELEEIFLKNKKPNTILNFPK